MDIKVIILISVAFLNLALGASILLHNHKSLVARWFAFFALNLAAWSFGMMMYSKDSSTWQIVYNWSLILHFAGALIALSFFYFSLSYPQEKMMLNKIWQFIFFLPILIIFYFLFIDQKIIIGLNIYPNNRQLIYGSFYPFYFVYFFTCMGSGLVVIFIKSFKFEGVKKIQMRYVFLGISIALIFPAILNMLLAAIGNFRYAWMGPIFLLIVLIFIAYAIIKLKFLDIRVITTEIFAVFLILVALLQVFYSTSLVETVVRIIIFIITIIFAILLIRSVLNEVKRREEMERLAKELQKTTKKLAAANKELERLDEAKSEFLSIASHQLRTPLTVIKGYTSMILEGSFGQVPKLIKQSLDKVYISTERLIGLVESLLNISRIESGRLEFDIKPFDLTETVKAIVDDFQSKAKVKGLKLEFHSEPNLPPVLADPQKIKEVISNLIDNSIKYTTKGNIMVSLHQESQSVVFSCQDTGIGILAEDLPRLFNKFTRGKGMMQVYTEGTGLGLYFARMVLENMGGRIWAESEGKGKGSKFSFSLALADKTKAKKVR